MHLGSYVGKLVFLRLQDKRATEAVCLPTGLFLARVRDVDPSGVGMEWNRSPVVNKGTGERKFFKGELLITHDNIAGAFASDEFQRDVEAQAQAQRLAD